MSRVAYNIHVYKGIPTEQQVNSIPLARPGVYELSDKEMAATRRFLYGINKDNIRRYRTMREGPLLFVWRIK